MAKKRQPIARPKLPPKRGRKPKPPAPVVPKTLTAKEQRFIEEYCVDLNATQAAIRAGYSAKTAGAIGHENLTKPDIAAAVADYKAKLAARTETTREEIAAELRKLAFANIADFHRLVNGEPVIDLSNCTREQLAALTELETHDYTDGRGEDARDVKKVRLKMSDKRQSLVDLAKLLGYLKEKVEHSGSVGTMPDAEVARVLKMPEAELRRRRELLLQVLA